MLEPARASLGRAPEKARGRAAIGIPSANEIVDHVLPRVRSGDVLAVLSNGGFDGIHAKLLAGLVATPATGA